ncbi:MAG TPA: thioredoxin-like domain-containing protein [Phycisphaerales bacterium]|nr:thioredoxin-like domain-containing protein [Phycisphaerales bacterium]
MRGIAVFIVVSLVCTSGLGQSDLSPKGPPPATPKPPPASPGVIDANGTLTTKAEASLPDVQEILDAYTYATGGTEAWKAVQAMEFQWDWTLLADSGTLTSKANTSGAFRADMNMVGSAWHEGQGSDGTFAWIEDASGTCHAASESVKLQLQMQYDPTAITHLNTYARAATTSGEVVISGRPTWRIILIPHKGRAMYFFFDQETDLLIRWEYSRPTGGSPVVIERGIADYREVGGVLVPHAIRERSPAGTVEFTLKSASSTPLSKEALSLTPCAREALAADDAAATPPTSALQGPAHANLVKLIGPNLMNADGKPVDSDVLNDIPNVLLYFSAHWCGPCRRFTPNLVNYFDEQGPDRDFAVILVSSDRSEKKMYDYMKGSKMNWYTVPFDRVDPSGIKRAWGGRGIPNLVWLGAADQVVKRSYVDGRYIGPFQVLDAFKSRHETAATNSPSP